MIYCITAVRGEGGHLSLGYTVFYGHSIDRAERQLPLLYLSPSLAWRSPRNGLYPWTATTFGYRPPIQTMQPFNHLLKFSPIIICLHVVGNGDNKAQMKYSNGRKSLANWNALWPNEMFRHVWKLIELFFLACPDIFQYMHKCINYQILFAL